jgi:hypothetical protein
MIFLSFVFCRCGSGSVLLNYYTGNTSSAPGLAFFAALVRRQPVRGQISDVALREALCGPSRKTTTPAQ